MILAERDAHVKQLRELLDAAAQGHGAVVVISGPAGSGRTTLLNSFATVAVGSRARFINAVGSRAERTLHLGVVDQLFRSARSTREPDARVAALLDEASLILKLHAPDPDSVEQAIAPVLQQLCAEFLALAQDRPLIVGIDDAPHIDLTSLQCLLYLARRTNSARVLIVVTDRDRPRRVYPTVSNELYRQPHCHQIRLPLLSRDGVAAVLTDRLGEAATALADQYWRISGGNPLLLNGLLLDQETTVGDQLTVGEAFAEAVMSCLYRCESTVLIAARYLAVLGPPTPPGNLLDMDPDSTAKALATLEATGLLNGGEFRHPIARTAVLHALTPDERADLHRRAAQFHHENGASAVTVAEHLIHAGSTNLDWHADVLESAGEIALSGGNQHQALTFLRLAEQLRPEDRREPIRTLISTAEWQADPGIAAQRMPDLLTAMRDGQLPGTQIASLANKLMWMGQVEEAGEAIEMLCDEHGSPDSEHLPAMARTLSVLAFMYPDMFHRLHRKQIIPVDHDQAQAAGNAQLLAAASGAGTADDPDTQVRNAELFLEGIGTNRSMLANGVRAVTTLICNDRLDRATYWCNHLLTAYSQTSRLSRALLTVTKAWIAARRGDLRSAVQHAQTGLAMLPVTSWGVAIGSPIAVLVMALTDMGNLTDAASLLTVTVPPNLNETPFGLLYLQARGRFKLALDHVDSALDDFLACGERMTRWNSDQPSLIPWRSDAATAHLRLGHHERARQLAQEQFALGGRLPRARGISLRAMAAAGEPLHRVALLQESIVQLQESGDQRELAFANADLSRAHHATGCVDLAKAAAQHAEQLARGCGIAPALLDLPGQVHAGGVPPGETTGRDHPGTETIMELSGAERRVAELAAEGLTNRQIARTLFVTISTVEQHLTRVYRKMGIARRSDLCRQFVRI